MGGTNAQNSIIYLLPIKNKEKNRKDRPQIMLRKVVFLVIHKQLIIQLKTMDSWKLQVIVKVNWSFGKKYILSRLAEPEKYGRRKIEDIPVSRETGVVSICRKIQKKTIKTKPKKEKQKKNRQ